MMQKAAFFDIDGTVFRSSLLIEIVDALIAEGYFPKGAGRIFETQYVAWLSREGDYATYIAAVIECFLEHINGMQYGVFADVGQKVVAEQSKQVYRYTRDLIHQLKNDGYYIVAISQSPKTILDKFCTSYGFDKVYGRIYAIDETGRFTGIVTDEALIRDKAEVVKRVVTKEKVTLEGSIGVGDTEGDIPLLESVAQPICFNPNKLLYNHARMKGWKVVVERKDVIYEL